MTFTEEMEIRNKLEMELNNEPPISIGDTIVVPKFGISATIDKIYYTVRCIEWHNERKEFVKHYDVEFVDTNGNYRHWKSYFDGGYIKYRKEP